MRPFIYSMCLLLLPTGPPLGRIISAQDEGLVFRASTQLVEFSAVVMDKKGNPITDLRKEHFSLLVDGKPRDIAFLRYEGGSEIASVSEPLRLPPNIFTNRVEFTRGPSRNVAALLIDTINTSAQDQMLVKAQAMRFLLALAPETRVAVFLLGRQLRVLHDFTDDMHSLRARLLKLPIELQAQQLTDVERLASELEGLGGQGGSRENTSAAASASVRAQVAGEVYYNTTVRRNRVNDTLELLGLLARHVSGIPGRKSVVWITGGIPVFSAEVQVNSRTAVPGEVRPVVGVDFEGAIRKTAQRLAQAGVALYTVDARALRPGGESLADRQHPPSVGSGPFDELQRAEEVSSDTKAAFGLLAGLTGGRSLFNVNDFSEGIRVALHDLRGAYSIGFYAGNDGGDAWHTFKLSVNRPDVSVLHRQGYLLEGVARPADWKNGELRQALLNPLGSSSIHLDAWCGPALGSSPGTLDLRLRIVSDDLFMRNANGRLQGELVVTLGERTTDADVKFSQQSIKLDLTASQWAVAREKGIPYQRRWAPAVGTSVIRIVVRDPTTGRFGTIDIPMSAITRDNGIGSR